MRMHAGVLLAMKEDSLGIAIEPATLETIGDHDFDGAVTSRTMTAHPKVDPVTGEMIFYGSAARGETTPDIAVYVADEKGVIVREEWLVAPYASMIHDFAVTERWIVLPIMPTTSDLERIKAGGSIYDWTPDLGMYFGLLPRDASAGTDVRWIPADPRWAYHVMNAFDDGDLVHLDVTESSVQPFPWFHVDAGVTWSPDLATPRLTRWTIDTTDGSFTSTRLIDAGSEMPRIDERHELQRYRHGFVVLDDPSKPPAGMPFDMNSIGHYDHARGALTTVWAGEHATFEECQFVPRSPTAPEADGFLLVPRHHHDTRLTDLVVYDTAALTAGPVAGRCCRSGSVPRRTARGSTPRERSLSLIPIEVQPREHTFHQGGEYDTFLGGERRHQLCRERVLRCDGLRDVTPTGGREAHCDAAIVTTDATLAAHEPVTLQRGHRRRDGLLRHLGEPRDRADLQRPEQAQREEHAEAAPAGTARSMDLALGDRDDRVRQPDGAERCADRRRVGPDVDSSPRRHDIVRVGLRRPRRLGHDCECKRRPADGAMLTSLWPRTTRPPWTSTHTSSRPVSPTLP